MKKKVSELRFLMGCDYTAYTIIGCRIPYDKLFVETRVAAFAHTYPNDFEFDPKTGAKLWKTVRQLINGDTYLDSHNFSGLYCITPNSENNEFYYIGQGQYVENTSFDEQAVKDLYVKWDIEQIKNKLKELGIYDPETFGIWTILQSCC